MNQLRLRTEFSFGEVFGGVKRTLAAVGSACKVVACTDNTTYAHISFLKECKALGIKGILGYEARLNGHPIYLYARDSLSDFYSATSYCAQNIGNLTEDDFEDFATYLNVAISTYPNKQWAVENGIFIMVGPECVSNARVHGAKLIRVSDSRYPKMEDKPFAELHGVRLNITAQHIIDNEYDHQAICGYDDGLVWHEDEFIANCSVLEMTRAENIHHQMDIEAKCRQGIIDRDMVWTQEYEDRLQRELVTIKSKGFEDYFACVSAMMDYAKTKMLVGPARGSAAGSLVCYLMNITDIDPIPFDLLFERFIDETRHDFPDIDSDFQDSKRHMVIDYFKTTYGQENVAQIGTINRYKAKSALSEVAKRTNVPASEVEDVKRSLIVRSGGDARAAMCFYDTVTTLESGRALLDKYPHLIHASELENHARHSGKHAAGVLVANVPMKNYCTIDAQGIAQVDKYDCESINLMKIDVLGLKTLSVLADAMGDSPIDLTTIQLDDEEVFEIFNKGHLSGVFQFEGQAVQSLCAQIGVHSFEDIVSITSLGRPGPLVSGGAAKFIARKRGDQAIEYIHPIYDEITKNTYGLVLYQEQVMSILKQVGQMEWADVQILRRAMSKSLGLEFFEKFYDRFLAGATANGMTESATRNCWELLITFGSYGFNRCLDGDTLIHITHSNEKHRGPVSIKDLYRIYEEEKSWYMKHHNSQPHLLSYDEASGRSFPQKSTRIWKTGEKNCVKFTFDDGSFVVCTLEHKFIINGKWSAAGFAIIGDEFASMVNEKAIFDNGGKGHNKGKHWNIDGSGCRKGIANPSYKNGKTIAFHAFKKANKDKPCSICGLFMTRMEAHHNDFNGGNDRPEDLTWLCVSCHKETHYKHGRVKRHEKGRILGKKLLVSKEDVGVRETYDIEMPDEHNFMLANELITHNSHAVAYALLSYYCAYFKAYHTVEYACASLNHQEMEAKIITTLRELVKEGTIEYVPFDRDHSIDRWNHVGNKLIGPLTAVKGVGDKKAAAIIERRKTGKLTASDLKLLSSTDIKASELFAIEKEFGDYYANPASYDVLGKVIRMNEVGDEHIGSVTFIGKMVQKNLRDLNENIFLSKRDGQLITRNSAFINFRFEDDTDKALATIGRYDMARLSGEIIDAPLGSIWLIKGQMKGRMKKVYLSKLKRLK